MTKSKGAYGSGRSWHIATAEAQQTPRNWNSLRSLPAAPTEEIRRTPGCSGSERGDGPRARPGASPNLPG